MPLLVRPVEVTLEWPKKSEPCRRTVRPEGIVPSRVAPLPPTWIVPTGSPEAVRAPPLAAMRPLPEKLPPVAVNGAPCTTKVPSAFVAPAVWLYPEVPAPDTCNAAAATTSRFPELVKSPSEK